MCLWGCVAGCVGFKGASGFRVWGSGVVAAAFMQHERKLPQCRYILGFGI